MPLPVFETQDQIPEPFRAAYVERDGKWVPDDSDVAGLKESQRRALDEKKKAAAEAQRLRDAMGDMTPEEIVALRDARRQAEEDRLRKGDPEKLIEKRVNEAIAPLKQELEAARTYKQKYEDAELDRAIRSAAGASKVRGEMLDDVVELTRGKRIKLGEDGRMHVYDRDGDPLGVTVEQFFAETLKKEKPYLYDSALGSGGGATGGSGGAAVVRNGVVRVDPTNMVDVVKANLDGVLSGKVQVQTAA